MKRGWWFLADEFNLADPIVMGMLFPLLEGQGKILVPGTDKVVVAKPGFRFFATQNDASYASRHQLPVSLRNRFLEVQVEEFPENELPVIIKERRVCKAV
jgi:midasin